MREKEKFDFQLANRLASQIDPQRPVLRETDNNDVLPEAGTTRNLVSVWKNLESTDVSQAARQRAAPEVSLKNSGALAGLIT